ncbi:MAG: AraC family transcriptional regulator [Oleiphilaceae bacterium]|nr:AraC family transcriptional regulator [Oleiphilaceae bacterium]
MKPTKLPLGDISVNFVGAIVATLRSLQVDPRPLMQRFNLSQEFMHTPNARISIPKFMRLGYEAIRLSNTPQFGLLMGPNMKVTEIGMAGFAAMSAPTLYDAMTTLIDYETLSSQNCRGHSRHYSEDGRLVCEFYSISPYNQFNYFVVDSMLSTWYLLACWFSERKDLIHQVDIEHGNQSYRDAYESLFECPINFSASRNALVLKRGVETSANRFGCRSSYAQTRSLCEEIKQELSRGKTTTDRVVELIGSHLSGDPPDIGLIAQKMGMAGWTLRRRLNEEGTQFKALLDETRHALARTYVGDTEHNFTEIAFLLGFSSPAAFQRAFKRWTTQTPGQFRKIHANESKL